MNIVVFGEKMAKKVENPTEFFSFLFPLYGLLGTRTGTDLGSPRA